LSRNPIDVFPSYTSLLYFLSHSLEPERPWHTIKHWPVLVQWLSNMWGGFHDRIMTAA
jgi:hypothetical protein